MILTFGSINADLIVPVPHLPQPGETVLGGPYHLGTLLEWIATAMPPLGETRVALPTLRPLVVQAVERVIHDYAERLLAEDLARATGVSPRQLADTFHECLGMRSWVESRRSVRMFLSGRSGSA